MTMLEIAARMWPFWMFGLFMMLMTYKTEHRHLLRVDKKAITKWSIFLVFISIYRYFAFTQTEIYDVNSVKDAVLSIPWQAAFTVSWEDACHGLPLALLSAWVSNKKWGKYAMAVAFAAVMLSFGMGHVYQGGFAAALLSLYIPFSYYQGKKNGFGTVMIGHILWDFSTLAMLHWIFGG